MKPGAFTLYGRLLAVSGAISEIQLDYLTLFQFDEYRVRIFRGLARTGTRSSAAPRSNPQHEGIGSSSAITGTASLVQPA